MSEEDEEEGELYYHDEEICNLDLVTEIIHHLIRRLRKDDLPDGIELFRQRSKCLPDFGLRDGEVLHLPGNAEEEILAVNVLVQINNVASAFEHKMRHAGY